MRKILESEVVLYKLTDINNDGVGLWFGAITPESRHSDAEKWDRPQAGGDLVDRELAGLAKQVADQYTISAATTLSRIRISTSGVTHMPVSDEELIDFVRVYSGTR